MYTYAGSHASFDGPIPPWDNVSREIARRDLNPPARQVSAKHLHQATEQSTDRSARSNKKEKKQTNKKQIKR